jgi:GNAT superfamily N-acetyltransferase
VRALAVQDAVVREGVEEVRLVEAAKRREVEVAHVGTEARRLASRQPRGGQGAPAAARTPGVDVPLIPADLAPGDRGVAEHDWSDLSVRRVRDVGDSDFALAYERLWAEFGDRGEMERMGVIRDRLAWDPHRPMQGAARLYEMVVLRRRGAVAALRDHTAVVRLDAHGHPVEGPVVVHLSHVWVDPAHRGSGLAAWLRAIPLQAARHAAQAIGCAPGAPVVLVAEMEPRDPAEPARMIRLRSYERAGFRLVDPQAAPYAQPDFRPAELLAGETPQPIPLGLVLRRVGRELESTMPADELAAVVDAIYAVYGVHVPAAVLDPLRAAARVWTRRPAPVGLLPPTA